MQQAGCSGCHERWPRHSECPLTQGCRQPCSHPQHPGHGGRGLVSLGFGIDKSHPRFEEYRLRFLDLYEHSFADETVLFDDINALLREIDARGLKWGIVTNKPMRFTDRLVPALPFAVPPAVVKSMWAAAEAPVRVTV